MRLIRKTLNTHIYLTNLKYKGYIAELSKLINFKIIIIKMIIFYERECNYEL